LGRATGGGDRRLRLRTLILIRWIAIVGQAFTIAVVHFYRKSFTATSYARS
jgi:hypothetical protein